MPTYSFKELLGPPGNLNIAASDINDTGLVVGSYDYETAPNSGMLSENGYLSNGSGYVVLLPTGATSSSATGINAAGQVVGSFADDSGTHGYIYTNGSYQTLDAAAGAQTIATDINASGQVAGFAFTATKETSFIYSGGVFTTISDPNAPRTTEVRALNASGQAVGYYLDANRDSHGFIYSAGTYTTVDDPAQGTFAMRLVGINASAVAIGNYVDQNSRAASFSFSGGVYTEIADPDGISTTVNAIGDSGAIVGSYLDSSYTSHGFIYDHGTYTTVDDPTATQGSALVGINNAGQLVGNYDQLTFDPVYVATPECFVTGTRIRTTRGEIAVEHLAVGDAAITASGARRPIRWLGRRTIRGRQNPRSYDVSPVRVLAHAFGPATPSRDLFLSPGHPVLVGDETNGEDGHLVPIVCLVNGTTVRRVAVETVTYWHVELDAHDILLAENLAAESYLDLGDRAFFTENEVHALANPDFVVGGLPGRCRPVVTDGPIVEAERRRLDQVFAMRLATACAWPRAACDAFA